MTPDSSLTWAGLLARWMEFARSAVGLPKTPEGDRWREATPAIISLSAVTHALRELDEIDDGERPLALDRAEILCKESTGKLHGLWRGEALPGELLEIIEDSRVAFEMAANAGIEWLVASETLVCGHPADLVRDLLAGGFGGDLFLPTPGVTMCRGAVGAFCRERAGAAPGDDAGRLIKAFLTRGGGEVREPSRIATPRQVYRQMDFASGKITRDLVVAMNEDLPAGQPLLVLAIEDGQACAVPPERGLPKLAELPPVEDWTPVADEGS